MATSKTASGETDDQTLGCLGHLAHLLGRRRKRAEADTSLRGYVSRAGSVNGPYHPDVCTARAAFANSDGEASAAATPLEPPSATLRSATVPSMAKWRSYTIRCGEDLRAGEFTELPGTGQNTGSRIAWLREAAPARSNDGAILLGDRHGDSDPPTGTPFVAPAPWQSTLCAHQHGPSGELIEGRFTISEDRLWNTANTSPAVLVSAPERHGVLDRWSGKRRDPTTGLPIVIMTSFPMASPTQD